VFSANLEKEAGSKYFYHLTGIIRNEQQTC
jgi:hypothetical protein